MAHVQLLVHNIEKAYGKGLLVTFVLMLVLGTFDATDFTRLESHLRLQNWDAATQAWIAG